MPKPEGVSLNDKRIQELIKIYRRAMKKIAGEINGATDFGRASRLVLLTQIRQVLTELGGDLDKWAETEIPEYYKLGIEEAEKQLQEAGAELKKLEAFTLIDRQAVDAIVNEVQLGFLESMRGVERNARIAINQAVRLEVNALLAQGIISGEAQRQIAREVKGFLQEQGLTALIDKSGRRWELDTYTNMLVRTKAVEARNRGLGNRVAEHGYDLVQVSDHNSEHDACAKWEGKVLSYTGAIKKGTRIGKWVVAGSYQDALNGGIFHPNCRHALNVLDPDIASQTTAYERPTFTPPS